MLKSFSSRSRAARGDQQTQRVRVGMIGLAAVMLFIGLAAALLSMVARDKPMTLAGASKSQVMAQMLDNQAAAARDKEPLVELGAAPSATPVPKRH